VNPPLNWTLLIVGTVFLIAAIIPAYGILSTWSKVPWRSNPLGRALHGKNLALAVILTLQAIGITLVIFGLGRPLWFEVLRVAALGWVAWTLWRQWFAYRDILDTEEAARRALHNRDPDPV
jgi:threonine/homoserine/homoserine lactone efflux protein